MISPLMPTYNRADIAFERGEGAWLVATDGRRLLDFGAGIAVSSLGHAHPHLVAAIAEQAGRVMHVSNLYRVPQAERLARRLVDASFADSVFFCNSGAEANEGMVKLIRRAMYATGRPERTRILCFESAFHGRTLAMLSATGSAKYLEGFGAPVQGFDHVPLNNLNAVGDAITSETAGIIVEPIQGEGGVRSADERFLRDLRTTCDEFGLFLGFDEVQSGIGRTGRLFAHEWADVRPDIVSSAKGLGGGFPLGAILATEELARHLTPGSHGTTFGGNPLACAAGSAVLDVVLAEGFLDHVTTVAETLRTALDGLIADNADIFAGVRGRGLLLGLHCVAPNAALQAACMEAGLLVLAAGENVLRLTPPLVITEADVHEAARRLAVAAAQVRDARPKAVA